MYNNIASNVSNKAVAVKVRKVMKKMKRVFFDVETTGFTPGMIGQLSAIVCDTDKQEIEAKNYFFEIDYISEGAEKVCGRGVDFYREASKGKRFGDYAEEIYNIFNNEIIVAHNIKFDENFLSTELWRCNKVIKFGDRFDTMTYFKDVCQIPGKYGRGYKNPKLEEVVNFYRLDEEKILAYTKKLFKSEDDTIGYHDARYDTTAMFIVFQIVQEAMSNKNDWRKVFSK